MSDRIPAAFRQQIRDRAAGRCEYCLIGEEDVLFPHQPDHVIAVKHGGATHPDNLAWACFLCNRYKGSDVASIDPQSRKITRLFHPRTDVWDEHFILQGGRIAGLSAEGRTTAALLRFNLDGHVRVRRLLLQAGRWPG